MKQKIKHSKISLPCLRGKMGDWFYYISLLSFQEINDRVKLPDEINKFYRNNQELKLSEWIQRKLIPRRINEIANYLISQNQRFFNSLILGIYEGNPTWQDIKISESETYEKFPVKDLDYFSRSFGILTLNGDEDIFPIDGQHRVVGIREAIKRDKKLKDEENAVIFVAHHTSEEGMIRTRRLFSTLNKYAKPVSPAEIIALSEDNNVALITRELSENWNFLKGKVAINKNKSLSIHDKTSFTNILVLAEVVKILTTNCKVASLNTKGFDQKSFMEVREDESIIANETRKIKKYLKELSRKIPSVANYFNFHEVNRAEKKTNLIFRPIGQMIYFSVFKVCKEKGKLPEFYQYFEKDTFNLENPVWRKLFWDEETETINTEKKRQRYSILLLLEYFGIKISRNKKDTEIHESMAISIDEII